MCQLVKRDVKEAEKANFSDPLTEEDADREMFMSAIEMKII